MLLNSIQYFEFLLSVFIIYYILPDKFRWIAMLASSITFYAIGGASTISVPIIIILSTYACGVLIEQSLTAEKKKIYFRIGLIINLGLLVFYKYINFFIASYFDALNCFRHIFTSNAVVQDPLVLKILVPIGISYITFQAIGYLIEINKNGKPAEKNIGLFATYLFFFPKLLSGPIERAHHFLPQLREKHPFDFENITAGSKRILWGLFLKLVLANRIALYTEAVFGNYQKHAGITLLLASILFAIQLFADFAGYTEMAIGSARLLGYKLMENFDSPFIATSVTEFWRRWHMSLTTWVADYIYNPIAINRRYWDKWGVVFAGMVTFLILGFWHGASWNFIIFGFLQGLILAVEFLTRKARKNFRKRFPAWIDTIGGMIFMFGYFCFTSIFFKAENAAQAIAIIKKIVTLKGPLFVNPPSILIYSIAGIIMLSISGLIEEKFGERISFFNNKNWLIRSFAYAYVIIVILLFGVFDGGQFIYFKF